MTAAEFLDKLNHQQQTAYVEGAIEMLAYGLDKAKPPASSTGITEAMARSRWSARCTSTADCPCKACCRCWPSDCIKAFCPHRTWGRRVREARPMSGVIVSLQPTLPRWHHAEHRMKASLILFPHRNPNRTKLYDRRGYDPEKTASFLAILLSIGARSCVAHEISSLPWFFLWSCQ